MHVCQKRLIVGTDQQYVPLIAGVVKWVDAAAESAASSSTHTPSGFRAVSPEAPVTPANSSETFPQHSTSAPSPSYLSTDACLATEAVPAMAAALTDGDQHDAGSSASSTSTSQEQAPSEASLQSLNGQPDSEPGATAATAGTLPALTASALSTSCVVDHVCESSSQEDVIWHQ